jgi:hypothetical protein
MHSTRLTWLLPLLLAACATGSKDTIGPPAKEVVVAVTADNRLIRFNAGQPQRLLSSLALRGLKPGEQVLGIDFRVARNQLYLLASSGQLYRVKVEQGELEPIGAAVPLPVAGSGEWGFDFNPTVDRIRVVNSHGSNLRRHQDTGVQVDGDANLAGIQGDAGLHFDPQDRNAGQRAEVVAAAYTYNKDDEKLTTNYAIDAARGLLLMQGSREGRQPVVSPNSGRLFTVGSLGLKPFTRAQFDISDVRNEAYLAVNGQGDSGDTLLRVDLEKGSAKRIGAVAGGVQLRGLAIEP